MKLSSEAINGLNFSNKAKGRLMCELDVSKETIYRWLRENRANGELTRVMAIRLIAEELNLPESAILTE